MPEDVESSLDCPDCQLQLLQQQQNQNQVQNPPESSNSIPSSTTQVTGHDTSLNHRTTLEVGFSHLGKATHYSQVESHHYQLSTIQNIRTPSASGLNVYHYGSDFNTSISNSSMHQTTSLQGISASNPPNSSMCITPHGSSDLNYTNGPIESCDYNGYCSTCAVLDLPSNDKYYHRPTNSRPHVFPPIFYSQGPSSVIPGFSSISDWTNGEYTNHYGYTYSQPTPPSSVPVASSSTDHPYGSSNHPSHTPVATSNHLMPSSFDVFPSNNGTSSMLQHSYQNQRHQTHAPSSIFSNTATIGAHSPIESHHVGTLSSPASTKTDSNKAQELSHAKPVGPNCFVASSPTQRSPNMSTSQTVHQHTPIPDSSDGDSSLDSDCDSSLDSEDRELISVVEEDEDDDDETESTRVRPGGKCLICRNLIEITDCSSPQLAKFLENIEDDIDLDMTGDIEIGGMEDEPNLHKKRHASGPYSGMLSTSRLAILLGPCSKNGFEQDEAWAENDIAILCFRCGKLAAMADSLERQLSTTIQTLHYQLMTNSHSTQSSPSILIQFGKSARLEECASTSHQFQIHNYNHKEVQTELVEQSTRGTQMMFPSQIMDAMTQCCSNDFSILSIDQESHNSPSTCSNNDSSLEDSQSEPDEPNFEISNSHIQASTPHSNTPGDSLNLNQFMLSDDNTDNIRLSSLPVDNAPVEIVSPQNTFGEETHSNSVESDQFKEVQTRPVDIDAIFSSEVECANKSLINNNDHMNSECNQNLNVCDSCKRVFSTKSNLKAHTKICKARLDQEERVTLKGMKCAKCGVGFRNVLRQRQHMEQGCKALNFKCDHCQRKFHKLSELKSHLHVHKGEKPFSCDKCGVSFATKGNQMAHSKTHSDDKQMKFHCRQCDKAFNRRFALTVHLNRHNGVKPFPCNWCDKSFPDPSYLTKHKKKFHHSEVEKAS